MLVTIVNSTSFSFPTKLVNHMITFLKLTKPVTVIVHLTHSSNLFSPLFSVSYIKIAKKTRHSKENTLIRLRTHSTLVQTHARLDKIAMKQTKEQLMSTPIVFITGATSGIGKATAIRFAKDGYHVILAARRTECFRTSRCRNAQDQSPGERNRAACWARLRSGGVAGVARATQIAPRALRAVQPSGSSSACPATKSGTRVGTYHTTPRG